jgi:hypothetical protein
MRTYVAGAASAVLLGLASLAHGAALLSPPLPTGVGTSGACHIRNTGTTPVTIQVSVFGNNTPVINFDLCSGAPLAAGRTCVVDVDLPDDSYVACSVTAPNVSKLRGTLEVRERIRSANFPVIGLLTVIVAEDLR